MNQLFSKSFCQLENNLESVLSVFSNKEELLQFQGEIPYSKQLIDISPELAWILRIPEDIDSLFII